VRYPGGDRGVAQADGEHGLADAGRADEQHVGGVVEEPQAGQFGDELAVGGRLGVEVEVGDLPGGGQAGEPGRAGLAPGLGGGDFQGEQAFQEGGVAELPGAGVVEFGGQCFGGRGHPQRRQVGAHLLVDLVLAHWDASASSA
jgi:hypothetical protein